MVEVETAEATAVVSEVDSGMDFVMEGLVEGMGEGVKVEEREGDLVEVVKAVV